MELCLLWCFVSLYVFLIAALCWNEHQCSILKQHPFTISQFCPPKVHTGSTWSFVRAAQSCDQGVTRPGLLTGNSREESSSKNIQVVRRIQPLVVVGLLSTFPHWLSVDVSCIPYHVALPSPNQQQYAVSFSRFKYLWLSLPPAGGSFLF